MTVRVDARGREQLPIGAVGNRRQVVLVLAGELAEQLAGRGAPNPSLRVAFSHPSGVRGAESVALHVGDGGEILAQRADGAALTISVGGERYGGCLGRLTLPRLAGGYLPILQTAYVDGHGGRYRQESFAARVPDDGPLVSFVRLTADARASATGASMRFAGLSAGLSLAVRHGARRTVAIAWPLGAPAPERIGLSTYVSTRSRIVGYWTRRLAEGACFEVPERRVMNAQRALLIQNSD